METATAGMGLPQQPAAVPPALCSVADFEKLAAAALSVHQTERQEAERVLLQVQQHNLEVMDLCLCLLQQSTNAATLSIAVVVLRNAAVAQWNRRQLAYEASLRRKAVPSVVSPGAAVVGETDLPERQQQLLEFECKILQLVQAMVELLQQHAAVDAEAAAAAAAAGLAPPPMPSERRMVDRQMIHAVAVLTKKGLAANSGGTSCMRNALIQMMLSLVQQTTPVADNTSLLSCVLLGIAPETGVTSSAGAAGGTRGGAAATFLAAAGATLALQLLTELAREISSPQLALLQLTMQQHVECKKVFEKRILLSTADNTLAILNLLLHVHASSQQQQRHRLLEAAVALLELLMDWNFASFLLRFLTPSDISFAPSAEWLPIFFPSSNQSEAQAAVEAAGARSLGGVSSVGGPGAPAAAAAGVADGLAQQHRQPLLLAPGQCERPNLFALVLQLYKQLAAQRHQQPHLFRSARLILTRLAKFRAYRMVDAFFASSSSSLRTATAAQTAEIERSAAAASTEPSRVDTTAAAAAAAGAAKQQLPSALLLPRSSSGPISRSRKREITELVYVPLLGVLLDLLQNSAFMRSSAAAAAAAAVANAVAVAAAARTPDALLKPGTDRAAVAAAIGTASLTADDEENLEEVSDLCFALQNLSECAEALPDGLFDGTAAIAFPLFVQLFRALLGTVLRADAAAAAAAQGRDSRKGAVGDEDEGVEAGVAALEFLLRALSGWADRLQQQLLQQKAERQTQEIESQQQQQIEVQQQQQVPLDQRPWWNTFIQVIELILETFIMLGLNVSEHRDVAASGGSDEAQGGGAAAYLRVGGRLPAVAEAAAAEGRGAAGGETAASLVDFLRSFAVLSRGCLRVTLLLVIQKLQLLQEELRLLRQQQQQRRAAAAAAGAAAQQQQHQQLKEQLHALEEVVFDELHFLLLLSQQIIAVPLPGSAGKDKGTAPQQLLRDADAQLALVQLTGRVFALLEEETQLQEQWSSSTAADSSSVVSPAVLESGLSVLSRVSGCYLLRSKWTSPMMLSELTSADKGQQVINAFVGLAGKLLRLLPHEEALTLECSHLLHVLALADNPTVAYLWESANFQKLLRDACTGAGELLVQQSGSGVANGQIVGTGSSAAAASVQQPQQRKDSLPLQLLSQRAIVCLYTAFAASTSMNDHIWSLAKLHVEEQSLQRSGTLLAGEVVHERQRQLLSECESIRENLRRLAVSPVDSHPLVLHALNCSLSMALGLVVGCTPQSVDAFITWLRDALEYFFAIANKYVHYPNILHTALKFFFRVVKAGYRCFTSDAAAALYTQYRQLAETIAAVWGSTFVARREEEDVVFSNLKQMYKLMLLLASSTEKSTPSFNWIVEMLTFCMRTIQPLTAQLRPADYPKVAAPLLQCMQILAEERAKEVLGYLRPWDVAVLMQLFDYVWMYFCLRILLYRAFLFAVVLVLLLLWGLQVGQALVVDSGRVRQPAFEVVHSFCRFFLGLQLQQQAYTMALEAPADAPDPFVSPTQQALQTGRRSGSGSTDAAGRPVEDMGGPDTLLELYVQLAHLVPALLAHALSNPLSSTDVDFLSDCLFDLLFMVALRAYALKLLLERFAKVYCSGSGQGSVAPGAGQLLNAAAGAAAPGAGGSRIAVGEQKSGGVSLQLLEVKLAILLEAVLQAVNELVGQRQRRQLSRPADTAASEGTSSVLSSLLGGPAGLIRYQRQQQAFRDLIKAFVAECSSPTAAAAVRADSSSRGTSAAIRAAHIQK